MVLETCRGLDLLISAEDEILTGNRGIAFRNARGARSGMLDQMSEHLIRSSHARNLSETLKLASKLCARRVTSYEVAV